jgi:hypothetical protein
VDINTVFDRLFDYYCINSLQELALKLGVSQPAISQWKTRNAISAVKKRCRELGIYNEIFGDLNSNINNQTIGDNHGNLSQTGNVYTSKDNNDLNNIDEAVLSTFKRAYSKCVDDNGDIIEDKLDELIIYLTKFK